MPPGAARSVKSRGDVEAVGCGDLQVTVVLTTERKNPEESATFIHNCKKKYVIRAWGLRRRTWESGPRPM